MTRRPRMTPWKLLLDAETRRNLKVRAAAHGVNRAVYARALINGQRPGATPGSLTAQADAWWDSRSPQRRIAIFRNHSTAAPDARADAAQTSIFDHEEALDGHERD